MIHTKVTEEMKEDEEVLKRIHHALMEVRPTCAIPVPPLLL